MKTSPFIDVGRLCYDYRAGGSHRILEDLDLSIRSDEYVLICGASGSGKSTLCRTFNGLIPHFYGGSLEGVVRIGGHDTAGQSVGGLFSRVGMVFQNPEVQLFNRTVEREIAFGLESLGLSRAEMKHRIAESAARVGIEALLASSPHALSGGQQQLVSIAAMLALRPEMIVLDEPYANLDPVNVGRVRAALTKIHRSGTGIIISEHRLPLTLADAGRVVVLHDGRIVIDGPPETVAGRGLADYGLEVPLAVTIGLRLGLSTATLTPGDLCAELAAGSVPTDWLPGGPIPPPAGSPVVLALDRVSFEIDRQPVLNDIRFEVHKGECVALVGANGAGKTTLLRHLNGLCRPTRGTVSVNGRDIRKRKVSHLARQVGMAFQNPNSQFFKLCVREEIEAGARALGCFDRVWIDRLVHLFRLEPLLTRAPYRLSEGEKKRVAFAAALAAGPAILALDEPTAGQDFFFRKALGTLIARLCAGGQAVLLVTQDLSFAQACAHRWLLMADGKIVAEGLPAEVMADAAAMKRAHLEPTEAFLLAPPSANKIAPTKATFSGGPHA